MPTQRARLESWCVCAFSRKPQCLGERPRSCAAARMKSPAEGMWPRPARLISRGPDDGHKTPGEDRAHDRRDQQQSAGPSSPCSRPRGTCRRQQPRLAARRRGCRSDPRGRRARRLRHKGSGWPGLFPAAPDGDDGHPGSDDARHGPLERAGPPTPPASISPANNPRSRLEPSSTSTVLGLASPSSPARNTSPKRDPRTAPTAMWKPAGPAFDGQLPRATLSARAPGWSECCLSWWRDLTPSLRNALRRW